ncbi:Cox20p ASCRUDRAFT_24893, partial [Ascoidea rubescens DSM 1968]
AFDSVRIDDFKVNNLVKLPCFRDAGIVGFSSMGVIGVVIFLFSKNPKKAVNWSVGSGLLGSTVGWEQCRAQRRRDLEHIRLAKEVVAKKEKPMMNRKP